MFITKNVQKLEAYTPGEQPRFGRLLKLNTNENPYPPSPKCAALLSGFDIKKLRLYPNPVCNDLRIGIARITKSSPENVFVGNGSDEVLSIAARCFVENDENIGSLDPSYSLYKTLAAIRGVPWVGEKINAKTSLFILTNPNAPTGIMKDPKAVEKFAKSFKGLLLIDEAYADFANSNCLALATRKGNKNVIVMRTFSKSYSLAGLRVGYCVGPKNLIDAMYKVKDSYNVDMLAQELALAAVNDQRWMRSNVAKVVRTRDAFVAALVDRGWDVYPSQTNFIFAKPANRHANELFELLKKRNIFVRYFPGPLTGERLRITIGTDAEMKVLLEALDELDIEA